MVGKKLNKEKHSATIKAHRNTLSNSLWCLVVYTIALLVLISCGHHPQHQDSEFLSLIKKFETLSKKSAIYIGMEFVEGFEGAKVGECSTGDKKIRISRRFWEYSSDIQREFLIFHELGHCLLLRHDHTNETYEDVYNCPKSIMNAYISTDYCYELYEEELYNELFNN